MTAVPAVSAIPARRRPTTWLAVALLAVALGMIAFMFASAVLPGHERLSASLDGVGDLIAILPSLAASFALPAVGAILATLRPRNSVGWILLVGGVSLILGDFAPTYVERSTLIAPLPGYRLLDASSPVFASLAFPLLTVWLPLLFPDGQLPGMRWRGVSAIAAVYTVVVVALTFVTDPGPIAGATAVVAGGLIVAAIASLVVRFRRAQGIVRQQMKWFLAAVALVLAASLFLAAFPNIWGWSALMLAFTFLPIAIGIAVLRHRLYEIDRLISRTLGWALVTGILVAIFAGAVISLQALLAGFTQGQTLAVAASTLAAFALFQPLRQRVQVAVDRRFDRTRYDGQRTVDAFAERLRDEVEFAEIDRDIHGVIHAAVRPAHVGVWLRQRQGADG